MGVVDSGGAGGSRTELSQQLERLRAARRSPTESQPGFGKSSEHSSGLSPQRPRRDPGMPSSLRCVEESDTCLDPIESLRSLRQRACDLLSSLELMAEPAISRGFEDLFGSAPPRIFDTESSNSDNVEESDETPTGKESLLPSWPLLNCRQYLNASSNSALDVVLGKFIAAISPLFLTEVAQVSLEYLVQVYNIHIYNSEVIISSILPYFESLQFLNMMQFLSLPRSSPCCALVEQVRASQSAINASDLVRLCTSAAQCSSSKTEGRENVLFSFICRQFGNVLFTVAGSCTEDTASPTWMTANGCYAWTLMFQELATGAIDNLKVIPEELIRTVLVPVHQSFRLYSVVSKLESQLISVASNVMKTATAVLLTLLKRITLQDDVLFGLLRGMFAGSSKSRYMASGCPSEIFVRNVEVLCMIYNNQGLEVFPSTLLVTLFRDQKILRRALLKVDSIGNVPIDGAVTAIVNSSLGGSDIDLNAAIVDLAIFGSRRIFANVTVTLLASALRLYYDAPLDVSRQPSASSIVQRNYLRLDALTTALRRIASKKPKLFSKFVRGKLLTLDGNCEGDTSKKSLLLYLGAKVPEHDILEHFSVHESTASTTPGSGKPKLQKPQLPLQAPGVREALDFLCGMGSSTVPSIVDSGEEQEEERVIDGDKNVPSPGQVTTPQKKLSTFILQKGLCSAASESRPSSTTLSVLHHRQVWLPHVKVPHAADSIANLLSEAYLHLTPDMNPTYRTASRRVNSRSATGNAVDTTEYLNNDAFTATSICDNIVTQVPSSESSQLVAAECLATLAEMCSHEKKSCRNCPPSEEKSPVARLVEGAWVRQLNDIVEPIAVYVWLGLADDSETHQNSLKLPEVQQTNIANLRNAATQYLACSDSPIAKHIVGASFYRYRLIKSLTKECIDQSTPPVLESLIALRGKLLTSLKTGYLSRDYEEAQATEEQEGGGCVAKGFVPLKENLTYLALMVAELMTWVASALRSKQIKHKTKITSDSIAKHISSLASNAFNTFRAVWTLIELHPVESVRAGSPSVMDIPIYQNVIGLLEIVAATSSCLNCESQAVLTCLRGSGACRSGLDELSPIFRGRRGLLPYLVSQSLKHAWISRHFFRTAFSDCHASPFPKADRFPLALKFVYVSLEVGYKALAETGVPFSNLKTTIASFKILDEIIPYLSKACVDEPARRLAVDACMFSAFPLILYYLMHASAVIRAVVFEFLKKWFTTFQLPAESLWSQTSSEEHKGWPDNLVEDARSILWCAGEGSFLLDTGILRNNMQKHVLWCCELRCEHAVRMSHSVLRVLKQIVSMEVEVKAGKDFILDKSILMPTMKNNRTDICWCLTVYSYTMESASVELHSACCYALSLLEPEEFIPVFERLLHLCLEAYALDVAPGVESLLSSNTWSTVSHYISQLHPLRARKSLDKARPTTSVLYREFANHLADNVLLPLTSRVASACLNETQTDFRGRWLVQVLELAVSYPLSYIEDSPVMNSLAHSVQILINRLSTSQETLLNQEAKRSFARLVEPAFIAELIRHCLLNKIEDSVGHFDSVETRTPPQPKAFRFVCTVLEAVDALSANQLLNILGGCFKLVDRTIVCVINATEERSEEYLDVLSMGITACSRLTGTYTSMMFGEAHKHHPDRYRDLERCDAVIKGAMDLLSNVNSCLPRLLRKLAADKVAERFFGCLLHLLYNTQSLIDASGIGSASFTDESKDANLTSTVPHTLFRLLCELLHAASSLEQGRSLLLAASCSQNVGVHEAAVPLSFLIMGSYANKEVQRRTLIQCSSRTLAATSTILSPILNQRIRAFGELIRTNSKAQDNVTDPLRLKELSGMLLTAIVGRVSTGLDVAGSDASWEARVTLNAQHEAVAAIIWNFVFIYAELSDPTSSTLLQSSNAGSVSDESERLKMYSEAEDKYFREVYGAWLASTAHSPQLRAETLYTLLKAALHAYIDTTSSASSSIASDDRAPLEAVAIRCFSAILRLIRIYVTHDILKAEEVNIAPQVQDSTLEELGLVKVVSCLAYFLASQNDATKHCSGAVNTVVEDLLTTCIRHLATSNTGWSSMLLMLPDMLSGFRSPLADVEKHVSYLSAELAKSGLIDLKRDVKSLQNMYTTRSSCEALITITVGGKAHLTRLASSNIEQRIRRLAACRLLAQARNALDSNRTMKEEASRGREQVMEKTVVLNVVHVLCDQINRFRDDLSLSLESWKALTAVINRSSAASSFDDSVFTLVSKELVIGADSLRQDLEKVCSIKEGENTLRSIRQARDRIVIHASVPACTMRLVTLLTRVAEKGTTMKHFNAVCANIIALMGTLSQTYIAIFSKTNRIAAVHGKIENIHKDIHKFICSSQESICFLFSQLSFGLTSLFVSLPAFASSLMKVYAEVVLTSLGTFCLLSPPSLEKPSSQSEEKICQSWMMRFMSPHGIYQSTELVLSDCFAATKMGGSPQIFLKSQKLFVRDGLELICDGRGTTMHSCRKNQHAKAANVLSCNTWLINLSTSALSQNLKLKSGLRTISNSIQDSAGAILSIAPALSMGEPQYSEVVEKWISSFNLFCYKAYRLFEVLNACIMAQSQEDVCLCESELQNLFTYIIYVGTTVGLQKLQNIFEAKRRFSPQKKRKTLTGSTGDLDASFVRLLYGCSVVDTIGKLGNENEESMCPSCCVTERTSNITRLGNGHRVPGGWSLVEVSLTNAFLAWCLKMDGERLQHNLSFFQGLIRRGKACMLSRPVSNRDEPESAVMEDAYTASFHVMQGNSLEATEASDSILLENITNSDVACTRVFILLYYSVTQNLGDVGVLDLTWELVVPDLRSILVACCSQLRSCHRKSVKGIDLNESDVARLPTWWWFNLGFPTLATVQMFCDTWSVNNEGNVPEAFVDAITDPCVTCLLLTEILEDSRYGIARGNIGNDSERPQLEESEGSLEKSDLCAWQTKVQSCLLSIMRLTLPQEQTLSRVTEAVLELCGEMYHTRVRLAAIEVLHESWNTFGMRLGSSLSETLQRVVALLDDPNRSIETAARMWVVTIEKLTGESLIENLKAARS